MKNKKFVAICMMSLFLMAMFAGNINAESIDAPAETEEDPSMHSTGVFVDLMCGNGPGITVKLTVDSDDYQANDFSIIVTDESGFIFLILKFQETTDYKNGKHVIKQFFLPIGMGMINVYVGAKGSVGNTWTVLDRNCAVFGVFVTA